MFTVHSIRLTHFTILVAIALLLVTGTVYAHGDENHGASAPHTTEVVDTAEIARLEKILTLLKQLIALHTELRTQRAQMTVPVAAIAQPVVEEAHEHADEHEHVSTEPTVTTEPAKLVIEVETHHDDTHVHVRYVDKPEEMFFVDADITDQDGIVSGIVTKTGLSADEVRGALKYME